MTGSAEHLRCQSGVSLGRDVPKSPYSLQCWSFFRLSQVQYVREQGSMVGKMGAS